jgi:hypothetical protein
LLSICDGPTFKGHLSKAKKSPIGRGLFKALDAARSRLEASTRSNVGKNSLPGMSHLTCLPLLITFLDPSCPIVIFSSSQMQSVLGEFGPFANIITTFSKPVFGRYATESISPRTYVLQLKSALLRAFEIHEERLLWDRLHRGSLLNSQSSFARRVLRTGSVPSKMELELRTTLSRWFVDYLLQSRYFDACSILWEETERRIGGGPGTDPHLNFQFQLRSRATHGEVLRQRAKKNCRDGEPP